MAFSISTIDNNNVTIASSTRTHFNLSKPKK